MGAGGWKGVTAVAAVALAALACAPAAGAQHSVRVGPDYFGVNYPLWPHDMKDPPLLNRQLAAMKAAGIENVRMPLYWNALEGTPPTGNAHHYDWLASDLQVAALATHGLRMMPVFFYPPQWAQIGSDVLCQGASTRGTDKIHEYALAATALARRYGPGGSFWAQNPHLPRMPITTWQLWNEPNLRSFWCPAPDPRGYAELFVRGAKAIKSVDPNARVITAGLLIGNDGSRLISPRRFLTDVTAARGDVWRWADAVGAHLYPGGELKDQFNQLIRLRSDLNAAGVPKSTPMFGSEIGWGGEAFNLTEAERAERYRFFTELLPSSNCHVSAMYAQAWTTTPPGGVFHDNGTGIADRFTGTLLPSGAAFRDAVRILRGAGPREAAHPDLTHCEGMPKLDRDRDGVPDHRDYHPLDRTRSAGPPGWDQSVVVKIGSIQRLGKPVRLQASCANLCKLVARGKVRIAGSKGRLNLKRARGKTALGEAVELVLKPDKRTKRKIRKLRAREGVARINLTATKVHGEVERVTERIELRRSAKGAGKNRR